MRAASVERKVLKFCGLDAQPHRDGEDAMAKEDLLEFADVVPEILQVSQLR